MTKNILHKGLETRKALAYDFRRRPLGPIPPSGLLAGEGFLIFKDIQPFIGCYNYTGSNSFNNAQAPPALFEYLGPFNANITTGDLITGVNVGTVCDLYFGNPTCGIVPSASPFLLRIFYNTSGTIIFWDDSSLTRARGISFFANNGGKLTRPGPGAVNVATATVPNPNGGIPTTFSTAKGYYFRGPLTKSQIINLYQTN